MELEKQIQEDIKSAMKAHDNIRLNAVRAIKASILLFKTAEGGNGEISDEDIIRQIQKLVKQRREAAEQYAAAGRQELADNELAEAEAMQPYLPKPMTEQELEDALRAIIEELGVTSAAGMGKVMGTATKRLAGKADGRAISALVKKLLS